MASTDPSRQATSAQSGGPNPWLRWQHPLVVAHRGVPVEVPEQTMDSFRAAVRLGADMIEADAQLSRDGQLVLMHDETVERTTDGTGQVLELTWEELSRLDAGAWCDARFAGLRIPLAKDLLELAGPAGVAVCLEAKGATAREASRIAVALAQSILEHDALSWAFVSSFHHAAVTAARRVAPDLLIAPERMPDSGPLAAEEVLRQARRLGAQVVQHRWELLTAELVDALHAAGIAVWAWNTNDRRAVRASLGLDVDAVMGDDLALMLRMREEYAALPRGARE